MIRECVKVTAGFAALVCAVCAPAVHAQYEQIHVGFLWHMHQPIYWPYETPVQTDAYGRFSFSVVDVHNQRFGPYTTWPYDAVSAGSFLWHLGAQVSFSGSLTENLNALEAAGINGGMWNNWDFGYDQGVSLSTHLGNPRLDMVAFGYHHPLMPLLDELDLRMQIRLHKHVYGQTWTGGPAYSRGMFPPETAFSTRIIPALVAEGIEWVLVDNIHFDRACQGYPHTNASGIFAPNAADQINPDPATAGGAWVQLNNVWAPSRVSVPFGYQPHRVQYVDPDTGAITSMIAVPAARYEGNEDGQGGYGAFLYDQVMDQYIAYNTDADHPMLVILHHDGDNYGGGSDAYYHHNWNNMLNWVSSDPDYDITTIEDYLARYAPAAGDVIHVEPGSWAGADAGDPEFKKWLGDPNPSGWSPDRNSWAVLTAAKNRVFSAEAAAPHTSMQNILVGAGSNTEKAWHFLLCGEASDYWYWDNSGEPWDSNVTRACNQAVAFADLVIAGQPDNTPPTIFLPQREPYNPGGYEWGSQPEPSDFEVWTFAYDVSGLAGVTLKWRIDADGFNPLGSIQNETYAGGPEVGPWQSVAMTSTDVTPPPHILTPTYRALRYGATVAGQNDVLIDYYVEAVDGVGNVARSPIQHVYVGTGGGGGGEVVTIDPYPAQAGQPVTIRYNPAGRVLASAPQVYLHYGFNNWNPVISPDPPMTLDGGLWRVTVSVQSTATQLDMVFNDGAGNWDNNNGQDWHFPVEGATQTEWVMDGQLDPAARLVAQNGALRLYAGFDGQTLYVAAPDAGEGNDHFVFLAGQIGPMWSAPWAKAGQVMAWSAFLGNENDNMWSGWQETSSTTQSATGGGSGWLEGTIDLVEEYGTIPDIVYLAFAAYGTANGAPLVPSAQVPPSVNGDGNVDPTEFAVFALRLCGDGDFSGQVGVSDWLLLQGCWEGPSRGRSCDAFDCDGDGDIDLADFEAFQRAFAAP